MRKAATLAFVLVLGAGCTGDQPVQPEDAQAQGSSGGPPLCDVSPATPPEGFLLVKSREFTYSDHIGVREDYEHQDGRLLVYLLGVTGEMGEGATVAEDVELASGEPAILFGMEGGQDWSVVWEEELPCPQMAVVGNGFTRQEFEAAMAEAGLLSSVPASPGDAYTEWLAVFDTADREEDLDPSTEELLETAGMDHIAVGQASCWDGLPKELGVSMNSFVAAVYGPGEAELDEVIQAVGREPIFRGELAAYCID